MVDTAIFDINNFKTLCEGESVVQDSETFSSAGLYLSESTDQ